MTTTLQPSKLGTKDYWDKTYASELTNFEENGDEGEIWFGEETVEKMVAWALECVPPSTKPFILEVGSGNGTLLYALHEAGYDQKRLCGVDYSPDAVRLAQAIASSRSSEITFCVLDFLSEQPQQLRGADGSGWDLVLDKGTFDAMALAERDVEGRSPSDAYPKRVVDILRSGGLFLITSCNFTEAELRDKFATEETRLTYYSRIEHPTFTFGGRSGSIVSSVAFQKPA